MMSSVFDAPLSDPGSRSGLVGTGAVASIRSDSGVPWLDVFPDGSVIDPETDHVPSVRVGRSHDEVDPIVYEHDTVVAPFVAVRVIRSPDDPPPRDMVGVVSAVTLSVSEEPESDDAARSGPVPSVGAVASTVMLRPEPAVDWFPAGSVRRAVSAHTPSPSAGEMSHDVAEPTT